MKKEEEVKIVKYNQKKTFVESCAIFFPRLGGFLRSTRSMSNNYLSLSNWFGGEREREREREREACGQRRMTPSAVCL